MWTAAWPGTIMSSQTMPATPRHGCSGISATGTRQARRGPWPEPWATVYRRRWVQHSPAPKPVSWAFTGDGGFMMTGQELSTAVQNGLKIIVVVCDNGHYGTILMHQHRYSGPGNTFGVALNSPDFQALGEAYGARSWRVAATEEFAPAFDEALDMEGPALIHVITDIQDISAGGPL